MIREKNNVFYIETDNTEYIFRVTAGGLLEHVYYGSRLNSDDITPFVDKMTFAPGNTVAYEDGDRSISLEHFKSEISENGKGDVREISLDVIHADGSRTCDFVFEGYKIIEGTASLQGLPSAYDESGEAKSLIVTLKDKNTGLLLEVIYETFSKSNVITRANRIINTENSDIRIRKIMSSQLDLEEYLDYDFISFNGEWADEMNMNRRPIVMGTSGNASYCINSSSRVNPFCMICEHNAKEDYGEVYGFNLIYSGNHYESIYKDAFGKIRFMHGINPAEFEYCLAANEQFDSPMSVMTYSDSGFGQMSHNMHQFVRENIVRGPWKYKERPVLINSWESFYFDINEHKLFDLAKSASKLGMELFVIDDGWFEGRNDDTSSLGDWTVDAKKFPHGLSAFADKLKTINMSLGIWLEPEMVNENSNLYRNHPEWAVRIPGKNHATGRNQMLLNLTMDEVRDYIVESVCNVLQSADISYVKWDMNRVISDSFGTNLSAGSQLEFAHRYMLGLYDILEKITSKFPDVLFESCSAGGNRFDLGMLCYMQQTWGSDNTDARCRLSIQSGYSYGYPSSVVGAHVSQCPNHQTLRVTPLETRFDVASFGILGYECNFDDFDSFELKQIKAQVEFYKKYRKIMQFGEFYRLKTEGNDIEWMIYDNNSNTGLALLYHNEARLDSTFSRIKLKGLNPDMVYHFTNRKISFCVKEFGSLVNYISPIHIRMNSMFHNILNKIKHLDSEVEDITSTGDVMMKAGIKLKEGFAWGGYNENIRFMPDNGTRLYVITGDVKNE